MDFFTRSFDMNNVAVRWQWTESEEYDFWFAGSTWTIGEENEIKGLYIEILNGVFYWNRYKGVSLTQFFSLIYDAFDDHRIDGIPLYHELVVWPEENVELGNQRIQYLLKD